MDSDGAEIGRAVVNYSAEQTKQLVGLRSDEVATVLGYHGPEELVSRNNLALLSAIE